MPLQPVDPFVLEPRNEVTWARGRFPDRTYLHASFQLNLPNSQDHGQPARYVVKVFDESSEPTLSHEAGGLERTEAVVHTSPGGRKQIKIQIARQAGQVREIQIQRVPASGDATRLENILTLDRESSARLIDLFHALVYIPVEGDERTVRLDDQLIRDFFADPEAVAGLYSRQPERFRQLIESDPSADDLVAIAHRKEVVEHFRQLLEDPSFFASAKAECGGSEKVWQRFLEQNPWILGVGLTGQLLTSWDSQKLEQIVAGFSIAGPGKRTDALLRTAGSIRSLVFAEIKHHRTELLRMEEYRSGCWPPSSELAGGVAQVQQTVELATRAIGEALPDTDDEGAETGDDTYLVRPRSFLILGHLDQLRGQSHGVHRARHRSFELYRRNLYEPEVLTFDELLARAEWHVILAETERAR